MSKDQYPFGKIVVTHLAGDGLIAGDVVYIAGHQFIQESEEEPDLFRRLSIVGKVGEDGSIGVPLAIKLSSVEFIKDHDEEARLKQLCEDYVKEH